MQINYQEFAERAVAYAERSGIQLDYSESSIEGVEMILGAYHEHRSEYSGDEGADTLWNIAVHFGIYLGETMLRMQLGEEGFEWYIDDGMPVLKKDAGTMVSPITKAHKRILNGPEDSVVSFCDVAFSLKDGKLPTGQVLRAVDVQLASGKTEENVLRRDIGAYIMLVEEGKEDFLILNSHDGYLQFYGVNDQFVAEIRVNLPNKDFRTFSVIDPGKEQRLQRISLVTPYGRFTPRERDVISLEQIRKAVWEYYRNLELEDFLKKVPHVETTEETKQYMG